MWDYGESQDVILFAPLFFLHASHSPKAVSPLVSIKGTSTQDKFSIVEHLPAGICMNHRKLTFYTNTNNNLLEADSSKLHMHHIFFDAMGLSHKIYL
jgi:hypothetical protein